MIIRRHCVTHQLRRIAKFHRQIHRMGSVWRWIQLRTPCCGMIGLLRFRFQSFAQFNVVQAIRLTVN